MTRIFHLRKAGFTLIELLVVISIISLLSSVMLASLAEARRGARNSYTIQTIRQYINAIELAKGRDFEYIDGSISLCLGRRDPSVCFDGVHIGNRFNDYIDDFLPGPPNPNPTKTDSLFSPGGGITVYDENADGYVDRTFIYWTMERFSDSCVIPGATKLYPSGPNYYFCSLEIFLK